MNTAPDPQDMTGAAEPGGSQPAPFTAYPHEGKGRLPVRLIDEKAGENHFLQKRANERPTP